MLPTVGGEVGEEGAAAAVSVGEGRFLSASGGARRPAAVVLPMGPMGAN